MVELIIYQQLLVIPWPSNQYLLWINKFDRQRFVKWSAILITGSVKSMCKWKCAHIVALLFTMIVLWLDVTWSGISYTWRSAYNSTLFYFLKLSDRLSDKLEGFTGQIWNLPKSPAILHLSPSLALPFIMCSINCQSMLELRICELAHSFFYVFIYYLVQYIVSLCFYYNYYILTEIIFLYIFSI